MIPPHASNQSTDHAPNPLPVHQAHGPEALASFVAQAAQALPGAQHPPAIVDYGQFHQSLGQSPVPYGQRVIQSGQIVDHWSDDMTLRVDGGTTIQQIRESLAEQSQWLALDNVHPEMTIAEAIAHNCYGSLRHSYGSLRDQLLGLAYVDAKGHIITVGGRTVKNVAGYDLTRFMVGSLNEFGLICQATLRCYAYPEVIRRFTINSLPHDAFDYSTDLIINDGNPDELRLAGTVNQHSFTGSYTGVRSGVEAQTDALKAWLPSEAEFSFDDISISDHIAALDQFWSWRYNDPQPCLRILVPPSQTGAVLESIKETDAFSSTDNARYYALPLLGVIWITGDWPADVFTGLYKNLMLFPGQATVYHSPEPNLVPVVDPIPKELAMLRTLKKNLDPQNLFNPGRFITDEGIE